MPDNTEPEGLSHHVRARGSQKGRLTTIKNYVAAIDTDTPLTPQIVSGLEARLERLTDAYNEFLSTQLDIDLLFDKIPDSQAKVREDFENSYFDIHSQIKHLIKINTPNSNAIASEVSISRTTAHQVRLPKITLPAFSGKLEDWLEFRDTYESLIHTNSGINCIEKFHYLRSSLSGEAALVVSSLEFSNRAYIEAWKLLCHRYNNPRLLIHNHVKAIFSFEIIHKESAIKIRHMLDTLSKHLAALEILEEPTKHWDTLLIHVISSKLDPATAREWEERQIAKGNEITLKYLITFLENKANVIESVNLKRADGSDKHSQPNNDNKHKYYSKQTTRSFATYTNTISCSFCKQEHSISNCNEFLKFSVNDRFAQAKSLRLCINCLRPGHSSTQCRSSLCRICGRKHNSLLHFENTQTNLNANAKHCDTGQPITFKDNDNSSGTISSNCCETDSAQVVLATALVSVYDVYGRAHTVRALLDSCSQSSFVTHEVAKMLGLKTTQTDIVITGIKECRSTAQAKCCLNLQSLRTSFSITLTTLILPKITSDVPLNFLDRSKFNIPKHLCLADPRFFISQKIDLLLGADCFWQLLSIGQHSLGPNMPIMQKTKLGWIISGPMAQSEKIMCNVSLNCNIESQLTKFWEMEEFSDKKPYSVDENFCELNFTTTTQRNDNRRFVVQLPLKNVHSLGESYDIAKKRFLSLERKLCNNSILQTQYSKFIQEYIDLGHMVKITNNNYLNVKPHFYLPHHAVHNMNSTTTRVRVVFDGSSKTSSGVSLNDCQIVGPVIQDDLFAILLRFRKYRYVVTADVAKMYRQVLIHPNHKPLQRILWRFESTAPIDAYELQTVTYGTASASYLSIRCIHALATEIEQTYPEIAHRIKSDFYVDDIITGADSVEALSQICSIITQALSTGCFELHKWRSNCSSLVEKQDKSHSTSLSFDSNSSSKTLGLLWNSSYDCFSFDIHTAPRMSITKRNILSRISQIFDPLGFLAPCTIIGKMIMQKIWLEKLDWDSSVPTCIQSQWLNFESSLSQLNRISIPRCAIATSNSVKTQLHGFCDASEKAYGACYYIRTTSRAGHSECRLLCSKTRVAPLKTVSIPRLELCAAYLLTKLGKQILSSSEITFDNIYLWSDSTVVLGWIKLPPHRLTTFVSNRVSKIQDFTQVSEWRHVPTKCNPADLLSRGISAADIVNCALWWSGPDWLPHSLDSWPNLQCCDSALPELRKNTNTIIAQTSITDVAPPLINFENYSSMTRLVRVTAFVLRFAMILKNRKKSTHKYLSLQELTDAENLIIKSIQLKSFSDEITKLTRSLPLPHNSRLLSLSPFLDDKGVLRVGGRLANSHFDHNQKHPMLLPKHHVTELIFAREHSRLMHIGPLGLLNSIRLKYWPLSGRSIAKHTVYKCSVCFRAKPTTFAPPTMGNLPSTRVTPSLPLSRCGVDYAGPVELKISHLRNSKTYKAYIALFVCLSTKAVHLELVTSLSTDAFIASLRRFYSRRGIPSHIYSDNGSNFVGANREILLFFKNHAEELISNCAAKEICWHFSPPRSPNFGGLWEAGVKAVKHHLKRVVGTQILNYENYSTFLAQVESILNSRPLSPLSTDPNDFTPLTPGHFLIGRALTAILDDDVLTIATNRLSKFQLIQSMVQCFWKRWKRDYINTLQQKTKWTKPPKQKPSLGQVVILVDENAPILKWTLGRIVELHPGNDSAIRVVSVRTATGIYKRTITKVCPMPMENENVVASI